MDDTELNRLHFIEEQVKDLATYLRTDATEARSGGIPAAGAETADALEHAARQIEDILAVAGPQADAIVQAVQRIEQGLDLLRARAAPGHSAYPGTSCRPN